MTTTIENTTASVLQSMFTENTGRHFLDSGGAYGRNWERNQGIDFLDTPKATWNYGPTISTFHYLNDRLDFAPAMDRLFRIFAADSEDYWLQDMEAFAKAMSDSPKYDVRSWNSYNDETFLSQDIQWTEFTHDDRHYVMLQIHGGCDARGGYTAPRVFEAEDESWYFQVQDIEIYCDSRKMIPIQGEYEYESVVVMGEPMSIPVLQFKECDFGFSIYGSDSVDRDGSFFDPEIDLWESEVKCPQCGDILKCDAPYPY